MAQRKKNKKKTTARKSRKTKKSAKKNGRATPPSKKTKDRARTIIRRLSKEYAAECALTHDSPWQLLQATILSAQCTDERVNMVTPTLFERWPEPEDLAAADPLDVQEVIRSTGFFRNKTKSLIGAATKVSEDFGGKVPDTMDELLSLPGVARKTANVVLGTAFGKNEGVVVDTHVKRLSNRLGFTTHDSPVKIERDLMEIVPRKQWSDFSHWLIWHGRKVCSARKPNCDDCFLQDVCPSAFKV